ncbi:uncharacterized protein HD556DRAFT_1302545 [Suillus plorans]|uniref:Uncharacterized protein n=1 Tax=Suillus plorans TaxID=116603 RepID=A0A9P7E3I2_9AGAM|nr:uncharacterized protein HD556DRAFT_1302545 [Suillus plorans]KAG1810191.1 hypothetical protein HD556DRAFT_1302545 [Suillus plorans]
MYLDVGIAQNISGPLIIKIVLSTCTTTRSPKILKEQGINDSSVKPSISKNPPIMDIVGDADYIQWFGQIVYIDDDKVISRSGLRIVALFSWIVTKLYMQAK